MSTPMQIGILAIIGAVGIAGIILVIRAMRRPERRDRLEAYECPRCYRKQIIISRGTSGPLNSGALICRTCAHEGLERIPFPPGLAWTEEEVTYIQLNDWERPA